MSHAHRRTPAAGRNEATHLIRHLTGGDRVRSAVAANRLAALPDAPWTAAEVLADPARVKRKHALNAVAYHWGHPSWPAFVKACRAEGPNTVLHYEYRDGHNYGRSGELIVGGAATESLTERLEGTLDAGEYFIAHQVDVPEVFLWDPSADYETDGYPDHMIGSRRFKISDADHVWHRYGHVETTDAPINDAAGRTFEALVCAFENAARAGWKDGWEPGEARP